MIGRGLRPTASGDECPQRDGGDNRQNPASHPLAIRHRRPRGHPGRWGVILERWPSRACRRPNGGTRKAVDEHPVACDGEAFALFAEQTLTGTAAERCAARTSTELEVCEFSEASRAAPTSP